MANTSDGTTELKKLYMNKIISGFLRIYNSNPSLLYIDLVIAYPLLILKATIKIYCKF